MLDSALEKWLKELEEKLMSGELEEEIKKENLDIRYPEVKLLYLVIDKSFPIGGFSGLEECLKDVISMLNGILAKYEQAKRFKIAITDNKTNKSLFEKWNRNR